MISALPEARVQQRVALADVAVDHVHAARAQPLDDDGIEIDHPQVVQQMGLAPPDLLEQRARRPGEAEQEDPPVLRRRLAVVLGRLEIVQAQPGQPRRGAPQYRVVAADGVGRTDRQKGERERDHAHGLVRDVARGLAQCQQHERKLADLAEVQRREKAHPVAETHRMQHRDDGDQAAHDDECTDDQHPRRDVPGRHRNAHAEADEEERDEEIAQAGDLRDDVERVRERRDHHPGDQRTHLAATSRGSARSRRARSTRRARRPAPARAAARRT